MGFFVLIACGEKSEKKATPVALSAPDGCVTMSVLGLFPEAAAARQTYFYGCFEGKEDWNGRSIFLADSACKNGLALSNDAFPFRKLETASCPGEGLRYSCTGESWKILGYEQPEELFSLDQFKSYCAAKQGIFAES